MKIVLSLASLAVLSSPAWCGDTVITKSKHSDAFMGQPAKDTTEVLWIGKDHMRVEEGTSVTIVRADLKKMYMLDTAAMTVTTVDLPFDMKKYVPAEMAGHMEQMAAQTKITVTPSEEAQKIKDWNANKFTMTMSMPMGGSITQVMWVTKEIGTDRTGWQEMLASQMASSAFASSMAAEMKKIDGISVKVERTTSMMGSESKSTEDVLSVESKEAPAGHYEVPAGYTEKPFDPMSGMMGGPRGRGAGKGPRGG
jgi:hypothetical protein